MKILHWHNGRMDRIGRKKPVRHYLREWREHRGLSQDALAARMETTKAQISKLELNKREMTLGWIGCAADALGIDPEALLHSPDKPTPNELLRSVAPMMESAKPEDAARIIDFIQFTLRKSA